MPWWRVQGSGSLPGLCQSTRVHSTTKYGHAHNVKPREISLTGVSHVESALVMPHTTQLSLAPQALCFCP